MGEARAQPTDATSTDVATNDVECGDGDREPSGPVNASRYTPTRPSAKIARLAEGFALGKTQKEAAAYAGVSPRTARRWQEDPEFRAAVTKLRHETFEHTVSQVTAAGTEAAAVIRDVMRTSQSDAIL